MNRMVAKPGALAAALLMISFGAVAQKPSKASAKSPLAGAMHAMFGVTTFLQSAISPDGKQVAFVESLAGPGGAPSTNSAIYIASLRSPETPRRISASAGKAACEEHDIAWSPDSKRIAFLSDAAKRSQLQLFVADADGGPAKQLTHLRGFLATPGWSPDGMKIAVLFTENATRAAGPLVAETPDEGVVSDAFLEQRLTLVDPATTHIRQISPIDTYIYEFDWAPDGKRLVVTAAKGNGDDNWYIANLFTVDANSGAMMPLLEKPEIQIADPRWSPDGTQVIFIGGLMSDEPIPGGDVFSVSANGGSMHDLTPEMKMTATSLHWMPDSRTVLMTGIVNGETFVARLGADGKIATIWLGEADLSQGPFAPDISLARDGKGSAVVRQSFAQPPEVWAGEIGQWKQITHRNAELRPAWGEAKSLNWKTDIGDVQGWLVYPLDFDASKKYPMVVGVHGGPSWSHMPAWPSRWAYEMALPSQGYFLFLPNPRGSYGKGEKFTRANVKDFGYGDFRDIMAGVDKAIQSAPIDPNRLGLTGWSYGGYMTMWGVTQTNRFRAAVAGAGLSDWLSYYGENKIDQWMPPFFGATAYDDPGVYARSSPITFIKNVKTPTLIVVGDSDGECPPPQSYEFWHALKTLGVPTEFVIYPKEGHEFADPAHSRDVIERAIAWFNKYLQTP
ncbi:MAG: S9 family peptidase [Candidatus Acidiferrales bacterium]